jgi:tetratricopeptide (TPR) repeat protein
MKAVKNISYLLILLTFSVQAIAQSPKKYLKTGEEFEESKSYPDARDQYTKALELDPKYVDAYVARARVFEKMYQVKEAIEDYNRASTFDPDNEEWYYNLARLHLKMDQPRKTLELSNKALEKKSNYTEALMIKTEAYIGLKQYTNAMESANQLVDDEKSARTYSIHGEVSMLIKDWGKAEFDFEKAVKYDKSDINAYVQLSKCQVELGKKEEALITCEDGMKVDPKSSEMFVARANVYRAKADYPNAINDLSQALMLAAPSDKNNVYVIRGQYYNEFGQSQGAINDFTKVISADPDNFEALYSRAGAYETSTNYEAAMKDYQTLLKLSPHDERAKELLTMASTRLYELNKESDLPKITFISPSNVNENNIPVPKNLLEAVIHAKVEDASMISSIRVDGVDVTFDKENLNPDFKFRVHPKDKGNVELIVEDVYKNKAIVDYNLVATEIDSPVVRIIAPYASDDGEIYLENNEPSLYIEGRIEDESLIKSIKIDDATASYVIDDKNPSFSATLNILNKGGITITAIDAYGNRTIQKFKFNREGAIIAANNPMGKTWVVFIENSNYVNFASLEGPSKDVRTMKTALANYEVHNFIRKQDMTKQDFEKFFSIELRDLVRSNHVNSLVVWYAGHGKFLNESGYWIPIDAKRDDEFTYFNINSLKAAMQSYSKYITHTLVITDACESGPSFYQAMRSTSTERSCSDWESTRFKSSQVFSSAGYELASDDSQFTKTFANSLMNNPDKCIPIDKIVSKVTEAVTKGGSQKPKFGKIAGFEDENGTFFFMKR